MNKKISILLSTYNGEKYLQEQIESLVNQSYQNFEILARDDGSSDSTLEILKSYDIKVLETEQNLGAKASFSSLLKYAIENSNSEYFMFCDQDDIWEEEKIEKTFLKIVAMEGLYPNIPVLIHTDLKVVDNELNVVNNSFWDYEQINPRLNNLNRLLIQNTMTGCAMMINRELAELATPIPLKVNMHDSWLGLVASYFGKIGIVYKSTIQYRQHSSNSVGTKGFGIQYILNNLLQKNVMKKNSIQAKAFLDEYRDKFDNNTIEMLEDLSTLESKSFWQKRRILLKYKLLKQGVIRNIGLMVKI